MALWSENHWTSAFWSSLELKLYGSIQMSPEKLKVEFDHPIRWMEDSIIVYHCVPISARLFDICLLRFLDCGDFYMDVGPWRAILPGNLHATRSGATLPNESSVARVCEVRVPSSLLWVTQSPGFPTTIYGEIAMGKPFLLHTLHFQTFNLIIIIQYWCVVIFEHSHLPMFNIHVISAGGSRGLCRSPAAERSLEPPRRPSAQQRSPRPSATTAPQRPTGRPPRAAMVRPWRPWAMGNWWKLHGKLGLNMLGLCWDKLVDGNGYQRHGWTWTQKCCNGWWITGNYRNNDWWWEDYIIYKITSQLVCLSSSKVGLS